MGFLEGFEDNEKTQKVITAIIKMAKDIDLKVVAEGVETEEQVDFLKKVGCDYIQGYYYYRPMPREEFEALLG